MYRCPCCGEKLNNNVTVCPCCGRGNKNNYSSKYDYVFIIIGLVLFSVGLITSVSFAYEEKKTVYQGTNYSFTYKNSNWLVSKDYKPINKDTDVLVFNSEDKIYIQFDKEMVDLGFDADIDSVRDDLYDALYYELVTSGSKDYSNVASDFKQIGNKYYITANYNKNNIKAEMYILCYKTKLMTFYIVHNDKDYKEVEKKLLEIFETIEIK